MCLQPALDCVNCTGWVIQDRLKGGVVPGQDLQEVQKQVLLARHVVFTWDLQDIQDTVGIASSARFSQKVLEVLCLAKIYCCKYNNLQMVKTHARRVRNLILVAVLTLPVDLTYAMQAWAVSCRNWWKGTSQWKQADCADRMCCSAGRWPTKMRTTLIPHTTQPNNELHTLSTTPKHLFKLFLSSLETPVN